MVYTRWKDFPTHSSQDCERLEGACVCGSMERPCRLSVVLCNHVWRGGGKEEGNAREKPVVWPLNMFPLLKGKTPRRGGEGCSNRCESLHFFPLSADREWEWQTGNARVWACSQKWYIPLMDLERWEISRKLNIHFLLYINTYASQRLPDYLDSSCSSNNF